MTVPSSGPHLTPLPGPVDAGDSNLRGILWFQGAVVCFAIMDTLIKHLSGQGYGTWQIMFFRAAFSLIPIAVLLAHSGGISALATKRPVSHVLRSLVGLAAMFCFFYGFGHLPLADVYALSFAAPLFATALSVSVLKEHVGWRRWTAVLVGFVGVLVMLRPGQGAIGGMAAVVLLGALFYAVAMLYIRALSRTETNAAIVFYFIMTVTVVAAVFMLPDWRTPGFGDFLVLATVGVVGGVAQICFTQAFRLAPPAVLGPFEYTGLVWAVVLGFFIFGELPDGYIWTGAAIVVASGLYILHRETVRRRG